MAFKNCDELLIILQHYQLDYYTRGKALKVHNILKEVLPIIKFKSEDCSLEFHKRYENLKKIEELNDMNEYSKKFAHNLLRLILIVKKSRF
ncbi:MAG: hypothetical protein ABJI22_05730 [Maribacter sp.]